MPHARLLLGGLAALLAGGLSTAAHAQCEEANLVPNPEFANSSCRPSIARNGNLIDQYRVATPSDTEETIYEWFNARSPSTPDFYHECAGNIKTEEYPGRASIQSPRLMNRQMTYRGGGYLGIILYGENAPDAQPDNYREYISVELTQPLVAGETYRLSFDVNAAGFALDSAEYRSNTAHFNRNFRPLLADRIGAFLSPDSPVGANYGNKPGTFVMDVEPQVERVGMITDTLGWTTVSGDYVAAGGERYLTIGNFRDDAETSIQILRYEVGSPDGGNRGTPNGDAEPFRAYAYALVDYVDLRRLGPDAPVIDESAVAVDDASACGVADGGVSGLAVGPPGGPDAYDWRDASGASVGSALDLTGVPAGNYTLTVTRAGCGDEAGPFVVGEPASCCAIAVDAGGRSVTPSGDCAPTGAVTGITATTAGTQPLTYTWTDAEGITVATAADLVDVIAGSYTLTVRAGACAETAGPFTVGEDPCPPSCSISADVSAVVVTATDCGARTGAVDGVVVSYGGAGTHREMMNLSWWWDETGQLYDHYQANGGAFPPRTNPASFGAAPSGSQPDLYNGRAGAHFLRAQIDSCLELFGPFFVPEQGCPDACDATVDAGADRTIASGASTPLAATTTGGTPVSYAWTPAASLDDASAAAPHASPTATTTYTVVVDFGDDCLIEDRVTVTVDAPTCTSTVDAGADQTVDAGDAAQLSATPSGGTPVSYAWTPAASLDDASAREPAATPSATTTYTVTADFGGGCTATDEVTVAVAAPADGCLPSNPEVLILHVNEPAYETNAFDCFTGSGIPMQPIYCSVSDGPATGIGPSGCMTDLSSYDLVMVNGLYSSFDAAFLGALTDYLDDGGRVLFMVDPMTSSIPGLRPLQEDNVNVLLGGQGFSPITFTEHGNSADNATPTVSPSGSYACPLGEVKLSTGGGLSDLVGADQTVEIDGITWQAYYDTPAGGRLGIAGEYYSAGSGRCGTDNPGSGELIYNLMSPGCSTCCPDDLAVDAGPDQSVDAGATAQLSATANGGTPTSYTWTPAAGLDDPTSREPAATPAATTTYTVTVDFGGGCTASDEVTVAVVADPVVDECSLNLVSNGSFEEAVSPTCMNNGCIFGGGEAAEASVGWLSINYSPDYFEPASKGCPFNGWEPGQTPAQEPQDGNAYMGFQVYWPGNPPRRSNSPEYTTREFIGTELCCPLVAGVPYEVSGYYRQDPGNGRYTVNRLGFRFENSPRRSRDRCGIGANQVRDAHVWTEAMIGQQWTRVSGTFLADRGYSHVVAGNFFRHEEIDFTDSDPGASVGWAAYYNVDNIAVTPLGAWVANADYAREITIAPGESVELEAYGPGPYAWTGDGLDDPTVKRPIASPMVTTTYAITVDLGCSTVTTEVTVVVDDSPCRLSLDSTAVSVADASCGATDGSVGGITVDSASATTTYRWRDAGGQTVGTALDLLDVGPGDYTLTVTDGACDVSAGPFTVGGEEAPIVDASSLTIAAATCGSADGSVTELVVDHASPATTYAWTDATGAAVGATLDLTGVGVGDYTLKVTDGDCEATAGPFSVVENGAPALDESGLEIEDATCGESDGSLTGITLTGASSAATLSWTDAGGAVVGTDLDLVGVGAGRFTLTVTDGPCRDIAGPFDLQELGIPLLDASRATVAEAGCDGTGGSVTGIRPVDPALVPDYLWTDASGTVVGTDADLVDVAPGTYSLTATAGACAESHGPFPVDQRPDVVIDETGVVVADANCGTFDGSVTGLKIDGGGAAQVFTWTDASGALVGDGLDLTGVGTGAYTLAVADDGCAAEAGPFVVAEHGGVTVDTTALDIVTADCDGAGGAIAGLRVVGASGEASFTWTDAGGRVVGLELELARAEAGTYRFRVVDGACSAGAGPFTVARDTCPPPREEEENLEFAAITVANTMTPNGDGDNDAFHVGGIEAFPQNRLTIYNRWGSPVYEASGYLNDWQGDYRGQPLPEGTYYYALSLESAAAAERVLTGYITLLR